MSNELGTSLAQQARNEVAKEEAEKAKVALKQKLRELASAQKIVANIERAIKDLEVSISDGSFV